MSVERVPNFPKFMSEDSPEHTETLTYLSKGNNVKLHTMALIAPTTSSSDGAELAGGQMLLRT